MNAKSNNIFSILMLLAGSLLVGFSMGRWLAPLAAWIGPALILRYSRDHNVGRGYLFILVACIIVMFIAIGAFFPPPLGVFIVVLYGLLWSLPYLADRLLSPRLPGFSSTFVYPLAATTLEFLNIHTNPMGTWGATGFSQYGDLPLMQLASVTGMIGITFLMAWFASVANWAWENWGWGSELLKGLGAFGVVLAAVYLFGFLRLNLVPLSETIRVAGITAETQGAVYDRVGGPANWWKGSDTGRLAAQYHWDAYFDETVREAQAGAKLVLWPEIAGLAYSSDEASLTAQAQDVARQNEIYLAVPLAIVYPSDTGQPYVNKLVLIDPTGAIVMEHVKYGGALMESNRLVGD
jgi:apolipoprotein N-acyltransferase